MIAFNGLENDNVKLSLLDLSNYMSLLPIALEPGLIKYSPSVIHSEDLLESYVRKTVENYYKDLDIPLIIYDKRSHEVAGCTRFGYIDKVNKVLHIGWTWLGNRFQGTGLNSNVKYLMLTYAFEDLKFNKVEFRIDERNLRSRRAVEKLGAKREGILRQNVVMSDGHLRNSCCYGILAEEWPEIKFKLEQLIN